MTNGEIILSAMLIAELDPTKVVVDTFAGWKRKGYSVKKGEKAVFNTKIWKPSKFKQKEEANTEQEVNVDDTTEEVVNKRLILVNASFFTMDQVEKITKKEEVVA